MIIMKRVGLLTLIILLAVMSPLTAYASVTPVSVSYDYENNHIIFMGDNTNDPPGSAVTAIGATVHVDAVFYFNEEGMTRTSTEECYFMRVHSLNDPYYTNQLSFDMGTMTVTPYNGVPIECIKTHTPAIIVPSGYIYIMNVLEVTSGLKYLV